MKNQINTLLMMSSISGMAWADSPTEQRITRADQFSIQSAPANFFSGNANFSRLPVMPSQGDIAPAVVNFAAGTITNWHTHPKGQYLIVTEGEGRTQEWGKPIQTIHKGDVIWCPPNVKHWHGASEHSSMSHIAMSPVATDGKSVTWLEKVNLSTEQSQSQEQKPSPSVTTAQAIQLSSKQLSTQQFSLIPIAAFTAIGDMNKLKPALIQGLDRGLTVNEIKEVFAHQYAYVGFPRALNGMLTFKRLLEEREKQGIHDLQGATASVLPNTTNYYQLGNETLAKLQKRELSDAEKPLFENFSPTIDYALKAHLFGYLFSRDNLSALDRELVVLSTLSTLEGVDSQLASHLKITQNLGVDAVHMERFIDVLSQQVDAEMAKNTQRVFQQISSNP
ncbi:carboxymuconolactone decarboxylase [Acinetobacter sp. ANC 4204]|jgi:4-carboxymuconolactone decarboxylase|uniref:cupin domain-containing carboxymuconolactone decarboxylase family protein n=1 Tax=unclassified Acinetobacter TaxID=196816 RepID=UPI000A33961B|nr:MULTISPECIES: carboxymuconolactone decarboxylase family protein [unclassified Acinetobacter]OTG60141.1 carboxymuconolactone decarboxylase [Acinetobacter sp. ANC 4204]